MRTVWTGMFIRILENLHAQSKVFKYFFSKNRIMIFFLYLESIMKNDVNNYENQI